MLTGIFYGAMYGGSTTSILVRIPGEAASIMTCIDGHEMAKQGRAGPALVVAAIGSFVGGTVSVVGLMLFAPPLAQGHAADRPGGRVRADGAGAPRAELRQRRPAARRRSRWCSPDFSSAPSASISSPRIRASRSARSQLTEGISFVAIALGLFGVSEILLNLEEIAKVKVIKPTLREPGAAARRTSRTSAPAIGRGTIIGFVFGFIPGISHVISTFVCYAVERKFSKHPESSAPARIEGVAGPETANNATTGSAMIPLLVLGIPGDPGHRDPALRAADPRRAAGAASSSPSIRTCSGG